MVTAHQLRGCPLTLLAQQSRFPEQQHHRHHHHHHRHPHYLTSSPRIKPFPLHPRWPRPSQAAQSLHLHHRCLETCRPHPLHPHLVLMGQYHPHPHPLREGLLISMEDKTQR